MPEPNDQRRSKKVRASQLVLTLALLFATWLLWSGIYKPLVVALGVVSCLLVLVLAWRTNFFEADLYSLHLGPRLPRYWGWLLIEIIKANFTVARIILHPRLPISPRMTQIDASDLPPVVQATLANAITLTPGTLTVDVDKGRLEVHCLSRASAADLEKGEMHDRARKLTGT